MANADKKTTKNAEHQVGEKVHEAAEEIKEKSGKVAGKIKKKSSGIRKEFVEFINRGSVVDLAIGVAVGGAFNSIVNSLVNDIIMPIVGLIAGGVDFNKLAIRIPNFFGADDEAVIAYGKFLQACLQFLIIAWVFFLLVKLMNGLHRKHDDDMAKLHRSVEKTRTELGEKIDSIAEQEEVKKKK